MTAQRALPPPLEPRAPDCSICGTEVNHEDGWVCYSCGAYWPDDHHGYDEPGEWSDDSEPRCESIFRPFERWPSGEHEHMRWIQYRCILTDGHEKDHRNPEYIGSWTDKRASQPDGRAIPDPHGVEHFSFIKERRRVYETKSMTVALSADEEREKPEGAVPAAPYMITVNLPE